MISWGTIKTTNTIIHSEIQLFFTDYLGGRTHPFKVKMRNKPWAQENPIDIEIDGQLITGKVQKTPTC